MSWYTVDRDVTSSGFRGQCERRPCPEKSVRILRIRANNPDGSGFIVGAYEFCGGCADAAQGGTLIAFGRDLEGRYAR